VDFFREKTETFGKGAQFSRITPGSKKLENVEGIRIGSQLKREGKNKKVIILQNKGDSIRQ